MSNTIIFRVTKKFGLGNAIVLKLLEGSFAAHYGLARLEKLIFAVACKDSPTYEKK